VHLQHISIVARMSKIVRSPRRILHDMASIRTQIHIHAEPAAVWDALRDWGALHERLVPGFVTATEIDGDDRLVTFFNGVTVRERFVDCDEVARRLVWSIVDGPYTHHNGAAQVFPEGLGTRFVWTADVLPHEAAERTEELMRHGTQVIKQTLEAPVAAR
jgi:carbon monoxide dehydrogenase subunit G